jgi:uncharacterized membrane-anchored protein
VRKLVILFAGIGVLALVNYSIYQRERLLSNGRIVYLQLAPVDPRSLMQGDYMALRYTLEREIPWNEDLRDHLAVVALDDRGIAHFQRLENGHKPDELVVRFRVREGRVQIGADAFFFQEGDANYYSNARYGEARVSESGDVILAALCDENLKRLGPPASARP